VIDNRDELERFLPELRASPYVSVDTEADSLYHYPVRLCLVQVSLPGWNAIIDPLADIDLTPLLDALVGRELIFHGADFDLRVLYQTWGFRPTLVFDTMIAARLLGMRSVGLGALVEKILGVRLEKASQKANWGRRPLPEKLQEYARADTRFLYPLARVLRADLEALKRLGWHAESSARLVDECARSSASDADREWRIRGSTHLDRKGLAALRELWRWREDVAIRSHRPPYFVLSHESLIALAEEVQRSAADTIDLPARLPRRLEAGLRRAIDRARAIPSAAWPEVHEPSSDGPRRPLDTSRLHELERLRDVRARELDLEPSVIASRAAMVRLARGGGPDGLMSWQRELLEL
jgi:ribonuclease D